ncbi:MAG: hypothetical protein MK102_11265, partial [Fuerstiella sp.]|nr:hypothetical protein [Fuerstiella sp.]
MHGLQQIIFGKSQSASTATTVPGRNDTQSRSFASVVTATGLIVVVLATSAVSGQIAEIQTPEPTQESHPDAKDLAPPVDPLQALRQQIGGLTSATEKTNVDEATREQILGLLTQATSDVDATDDLTKQNLALQNQLQQLPE